MAAANESGLAERSSRRRRWRRAGEPADDATYNSADNSAGESADDAAEFGCRSFQSVERDDDSATQPKSDFPAARQPADQ